MNESTNNNEPGNNQSASGAPIGKFDSSDSLLKAYNSLLSEFTKRCQKLKESEKEIEQLKAADSDENNRLEAAKKALRDENFVKDHVVSDEGIFTRVIEKYLDGLNGGSAPRLLRTNGGSAALCPPQTPKDLSEAKRLADIMIYN